MDIELDATELFNRYELEHGQLLRRVIIAEAAATYWKEKAEQLQLKQEAAADAD